jgi:hypothetical protein
MTADASKIRKPRTDGLALWDSLFGSLAYNAVLVHSDGEQILMMNFDSDHSA